ncbi:MAG TPA: flagellar type III secretion system pore protein FliP [Planctomycetota bacterium]|nr:flagellar type III secretion system pore protein FliP [Planctomycetota bacterium]
MKQGLRVLAVAAIAAAGALEVQAQQRPPQPGPIVDLHRQIQDAQKPENLSTTLQIVAILTVLSLAPALLVLMTSFTRIVIVLSFVRRAVGTQEAPPNQVITGLALILTFMVMTPTLQAVKRDALDPYTTADVSRRITQGQAFDKALEHLRAFMFKHVRVKDVALFMDAAKKAPPKDGTWRESDIPTEVLVPAFVISELRRAFVMGFALFLPFLVIDLVVAATLLSMGMLVLPPFLVSLPFKLLLFVLVDGWHLVVGSLVRSFHG